MGVPWAGMSGTGLAQATDPFPRAETMVTGQYSDCRQQPTRFVSEGDLGSLL